MFTKSCQPEGSVSTHSIKNIQLKIMPGRPDQAYLPWNNAAYIFWEKIWTDTFQELNGHAAVVSDDFSRSDRIHGFFVDTRCVALGCVRRVHLQALSARRDSYFKVWSPESLEKLGKHGPDILIGSNICVDPQWRGQLAEGVSLKDLVAGSLVNDLTNFNCHAMAGTMRRNRGMDQSAHRFGATRIQEGVFLHGVEVELVAFYAKELQYSAEPNLMRSLEALWYKRSDFQFPVSSNSAAA